MATERPIPFTAEQVRATLAGRMTQTRRPWRWQPLEVMPCGKAHPNQWLTLNTRNPNHGSIVRCRFGVPGDRLWVCEPWAELDADYHPRKGGGRVVYRADHITGNDGPDQITWRPSIHMPRWASRIMLEVVAVRVQQLHELTVNECLAEGMKNRSTAWSDFIALWNSINAKRGFDFNSHPWVWIVEFKPVASGD